MYSLGPEMNHAWADSCSGHGVVLVASPFPPVSLVSTFSLATLDILLVHYINIVYQCTVTCF